MASAHNISTKEGKKLQQYLYVLEANITFHNGLIIPLLTEFCWIDCDKGKDENAKQDSELSAFKRLSNKLKFYFPRRKIIILLDSLYACDTVFTTLKEKKWEFMIKLPTKFKALYEPLKAMSKNSVNIPGQLCYREREQEFYWINGLTHKGNTVHVVACRDQWPDVSKDTGDITTERSEHTWISSQELSLSNVHYLCNLSGRKREFIEDSFNTEKNRGYRYEHLFSYNWNALQGYHLLMRLAHAINAISEFTKKLKKYIKESGCANILKKIFDGLKHPWLSENWFKQFLPITPYLYFKLE